MSAENEEIEVVIDDAGKETDPVIEIVKAPGPIAAASKGEIDPAEGLEALKRNLDEANRAAEHERTARQDAERRASEATRTAHEARTETHETNLALIENAIAGVNTAGEMLEGKYAEAAAAGDWAAAAKIQREMAGNEAKRLTLEQGKAAMEAAPKLQPKAEPVTDPVEHLASQLTPKSAAWVRSHPEYARDNRLYQRMLAAHNLAVTDGINVDTDDYFASVEKTLGIGERRADPAPADDTALSAAASTTQRRQSPAAAPVSRTGDPANPRPNTVRLTAAEVEIAEMNGMTPAEYAKHKLALQREGKITTH